MAKRRRLEAPDAETLAEIEAGFAAKPVSPLTAPIAHVAAEIARLAEPPGLDKTGSDRRDKDDAAAWRRAREAGRVIVELPLDSVVPDHLMRDRLAVDAAELVELKTSLRLNGQRLPIEVVALAEPGRFGLISGWRRLTMLQELAAEDPRFATIKALVLPANEAGALYTAMVEENELHAQISPYERGRVAVMAAQLGAFSDTDAAISTIFAAASKAKRSKIRSFASIHEQLGDLLHFPTQISERNGLRLAHALREGYGPVIRGALSVGDLGGADREWAVIEPFVASAEVVKRQPTRGGRPKTQMAAGKAPPEVFDGITIERVQHEDGYSVRLRGHQVNAEMMEQVIGQVRLWLARHNS